MYDVNAIDDAVKTLKGSDPERLAQHKEFNQWLHHDFVPKCGLEGQKRLKSSLNSISGARDPALTPKPPFHALWLKKSKTPKKSPEKAFNALEDLEAQSTPEQCALLIEIDTKGFWCGQQGLSSSSAHVTLLSRLLHTYQGFEAVSQRSKQGRRFTTLLIWYQVYEELKNIGAADGLRMPNVDSDVSTAIENVAADHKVDFEMIEKRRYEANGWLRLVSQFGPGALLLASKNRVYSDKIREDEYLLMHEYCVRHKPQILEAAKSVGGIAAQILVEGFRAHGMPLAAFLQEREDNLLTQHFRAQYKISTQTSSLGAPRLEQLADVAESQQPLRSGTASTDGAAAAEATDSHPPENQLHRQPSAADVLSPVCMTGAPSYAEKIPSQSFPQYTALYGVQGLAHHNLNNASMITGQQILPCGNWPVANSHGLHETMAPQFLPQNDVGGIHHDSVGSGCSTNDEWMRTVGEMFTQYGDFTSYPS
ncbi:hypothetical protein MBLNU13_g09814t1 [Cladosporium sp. NU13]